MDRVLDVSVGVGVDMVLLVPLRKLSAGSISAL